MRMQLSQARAQQHLFLKNRRKVKHERQRIRPPQPETTAVHDRAGISSGYMRSLKDLSAMNALMAGKNTAIHVGKAEQSPGSLPRLYHTALDTPYDPFSGGGQNLTQRQLSLVHTCKVTVWSLCLIDFKLIDRRYVRSGSPDIRNPEDGSPFSCCFHHSVVPTALSRCHSVDRDPGGGDGAYT